MGAKQDAYATPAKTRFGGATLFRPPCFTVFRRVSPCFFWSGSGRCSLKVPVGQLRFRTALTILEVLWGRSGACIFVHFFALFAHWWGRIGPPGFAGFRRTSPAFGWCRFPGCLGVVAFSRLRFRKSAIFFRVLSKPPPAPPYNVSHPRVERTVKARGARRASLRPVRSHAKGWAGLGTHTKVPSIFASPQALQVPEERSASPTASRSPLALTRKGPGWAGLGTPLRNLVYLYTPNRVSRAQLRKIYCRRAES